MFLQVLPLVTCPRQGVSLGVGSAWSVEGGLLLHAGLEAVWGDHDKESQNVAYVCERRDISIGNEKSFRGARHVVTFWALGDSG